MMSFQVSALHAHVPHFLALSPKPAARRIQRPSPAYRVLGPSLALVLALYGCGDDDGSSAGGDAGSGGVAGSLAGDGGSAAGTGGEAAEGGSAGSTAGAAGASGSMAGAGGAGAGGEAGAGMGGDGGSAGTAGMPECDPSAAPDLGQLGLEPVVHDAGGLQDVIYATQPPGSDDWYFVENSGRIMVWSAAEGSVRSTPFLDLTSEVQINPIYDERGLLGLAFAPDYETSGLFYVVITPSAGDYINYDQVREYQRSAGDPYVADDTPTRMLLDLEPGGSGGLNTVHNPNTALFGPDGLLYLGMGDGGGMCNAARPGAPQDVGEPYGKILRFDPSASEPYGAADNPFVDDGDPRVFHYGLRNPFRFSFDSVTGDLYIGDVGQSAYEEIDFAPAGTAGLNFGWPDFEGPSADACETDVQLREGSEHAEPIHAIDRTGQGDLVVSVVGGAVYRGEALPELYGAYLWGEYYPGRPMGALYQCGEETSPVTEILKVCDPNTPDAACFRALDGAPDLSYLGAIVEGNDNELYLAANGTSLYKVVPVP